MLRLLGDCTTSMAFLSWTLHTTGCNSCRNLKRKKADFIRYGICIWETNMVVSKPFIITAVNHFMAVEAASCNVIATVVHLTYIDNLGYEIITVVCPCMSRRLLYSKLVADSSSTSHLHWSFQGFAMARGSHDLRNPVCSYEVGKQKKTAPSRESTFHSAMHLIVQRKLSKSWCAVKLLRTLAPSSVELHGTRRPLGGLERRTEAHRMIASSKCWLGCVFSRSRQKGIGGSGYILSVSDSH